MGEPEFTLHDVTVTDTPVDGTVVEVAVERLLQLPLPAAATYAGRWVSLTAGDAPFAIVGTPPTFAGIVHGGRLYQEAYLERQVHVVTGPSSPVPGGPAVLTVHGSVVRRHHDPQDLTYVGTIAVQVAAGVPHLPVAEYQTTVETVKGKPGQPPIEATTNFTLAYSAWGVPVDVTAPVGAIPWATAHQAAQAAQAAQAG